MCITEQFMPAFVPQCQYDVFISYAQVAEKGWIPGFVKKLQEYLDQELGNIEAASIFWDLTELDGASALTPEITQALSESATLLIVLSKAYLDRPWCKLERECFFNDVRRGSKNAFVILIEDIKREERPPEIRAMDVLGFPFWEPHPASKNKKVTWPLPLNEVLFDGKIRELAIAVTKRLKALKADIEKENQSTGANRLKLTGAKVFIADGIFGPPAKDLEEARSDIRNWLKDQGVVVLPEKNGSLYETFYDNREKCEALTEELLKEAGIFVQLLGRTGDPDNYESWLYEHAHAAGKLPGKDLLLWRSNTLTKDNINNETYRALVFSEQNQVISCDLSEFQHLLAKYIENEKIARTLSAGVITGASDSETRGLILVDNDDGDTELADQLRKSLEHHKIGYYSVFNDFNEFSQMAINDTVDGIAFTFGKCEQNWAHKRYQVTRPLWLNKKKRPCIAVLRGEPDRALPTNSSSIYVMNANDPANIETFIQLVLAVLK
jgi:hypothetical protein